MNLRENFMAILNHEPFERMPIVHFGFWDQTLEKWCAEGHMTEAEKEKAMEYPYDPNSCVHKKLGFDYYWCQDYTTINCLYPAFEKKLIEVTPDGFEVYQNQHGVHELHKDNISSVRAEISHTLKDRESWETEFLPRLQICKERFDPALYAGMFDEQQEYPVVRNCGSLFGMIRNWMGVEGISYLYADDEALYDEIIETLGNLTYDVAKGVFEAGARFDIFNLWEDICFKNGPLVNPAVYHEKVGPQYKKITELAKSYGCPLVSVDCDGYIDSLIPTWFENGVNVMFPIEVGTWNGNIKPWREKYGKELRGVGGMNKSVFAQDYKAVDNEIERLKPLVALGGFVPFPDHYLSPDAKWENVQYYCDKMRSVIW